MFIAAFGADLHPSVVGEITGSKVVTLDLATGKVEDFAYNRSRKQSGQEPLGLNHPIDVKFGPDGSMYIVDFGVFEINGQVPNAVPGTGVIWRVFRQRVRVRPVLELRP